MGTLASGSIDLKSLKVASGEATSYITKIDGGGIKVHDAGDMDNYIQLTSNGMDIYKEVNSAPAKVAEFGADGINFYGFYYPGSGGTSIRQFGQIAHLGTTCQLGNDVDNHIVINDTGLSLYSKAVSSPHAVLGTSNNFSTYNNYKKRFKTTWEYGTFFSFSCSVEKGLGTYTFYVEEDGEFVDTGIVIKIDDTTYLISASASSTGSSLNYTFSSEDNNDVRTVNIMIEFTGNVTFPGPRFQFGRNNSSVGTNSCTIGEGLTALANSQIVLGQYNELDFESMLIVGNGTDNNNRSNLMTISNGEVKIGNNNKGHTIIDENGMRIYGGDGTTQLANIGYGLGNAQGSGTAIAPYYTFGIRAANAVGNYSVAEGYDCTASGYSSHAEGLSSSARADMAHAEGWMAWASGGCSHAEGMETLASGFCSHAQNWNTWALSAYQTVLGRFNQGDSNDTYAVIVGNGNESQGVQTRSNALTVAWTGDVVASGDITDGSGNILSNKIEASDVSSNETDPTVPSWAKASTKPSYSASEISGLVDMFYPIGSYYETSDTTFDPNVSWGGEWLLETEGIVHVSGKDSGTYTVNSTYTEFQTPEDTVGQVQGGEPKVELTDQEMAHGHTYTRPTVVTGGGHTHTVTSKYTADKLASGTASPRYGGSGESTTTSMSSIAANTGTHNHTLTGGGVADLYGASSTRTAHENMPPYIAVNRWHRVA